MDVHRQSCEFDPDTERSLVLTFHTTIAEWGVARYQGWKSLGRKLNTTWSIDLSDKQWESALHPMRKRTLKDVCELIAAHAVREVIRPLPMLGKPCATAGAFLTLCRLLSEAGAACGNISPSTPLSPFFRQHTSVFLDRVSRLAPGALPPVKIRGAFFHAVGCASLAIVLLGVVAGMAFDWSACVAVSAGAAIFFVITMCIAGHAGPASVQFGNLRTFRDLACALAAAA